MTRVVNIRNEQADVYIGRPSKWGNPYKVGQDGSIIEVINLYWAYLKSNQKLVKDAIEELKGKKLGCYCVPRMCHGHVLLEFIEGVRK